MTATICSQTSHAAARKNSNRVTDPHRTFEAFGRQVFADGSLDAKTKYLIAVAHVTQCPH